MPVLTNPRWERLAQELAQNKTATEAMQLAGYSDPRNSTRLTKKDVIRRRVEELQSRGAERAEVSVASLLQELEAAREKASDLDQLSAAVRAIEAKAKVSGVMVQRVEVGGVGDFDDCTTMETIADKMLTDLVEGFRPVDERDRQGLVELLERLWQGISDYIAAIKARPITAERCDLTKLPMQWQDLRPYSHGSQRRITNGNGR